MQGERRRAGGVQSVELLLATADEDRVAAVWNRLLQAGLPSQARHRSPSNRPHVTMVALLDLPHGVEPLLSDAASGALPVAGIWGSVTTFGRGPWTVVRLVEPSREMRRLHARIAHACQVPDEHLTAPSHWTPHVTLARRVSEAALPHVLGTVQELVPDAGGMPLAATAVRRWDGGAKVDWLVAAAESGQP